MRYGTCRECGVSAYLKVSALHSVGFHEQLICQSGLPMINVGND